MNGWLSDWVLYKAVQDPSKSFEYWEDFYMDAFGAAKEDVKSYYRLYRGIFEKKIAKDIVYLQKEGKWFNFTRGLMMHFKDYYTVGDFTKGTAILADAMKKFEGRLSRSEAKALKQLWWAQKHAEVTARNLIDPNDANARAVYDFRMALKGKNEGEVDYLSRLPMAGRPFNSALRGCWKLDGSGDIEGLQKWDVKPQ